MTECANCNREIVEKLIIGRMIWVHKDGGQMYCSLRLATPKLKALEKGK